MRKVEGAYVAVEVLGCTIIKDDCRVHHAVRILTMA